MLKLSDGSLACVAERRKRYFLNEAKYKMGEALGIAEVSDPWHSESFVMTVTVRRI